MNVKEAQIGSAVAFHRIDIELHTGRRLTYLISPEVRDWMEEWVAAGPFDSVPAADCFLIFSAAPGRTVFVRMQDIRKVTIHRTTTRAIIGITPRGMPVPPDVGAPVVLRLRDCGKTLIFHRLDRKHSMIEINEVNLWQPFFFKSGFLHFQELNGASHYIPVGSITTLEVDSQLVTPSDPWLIKGQQRED
ncbi:MAG: hypothetical protein DIU61_011030 [Bacteroidota bacterium]|jgi:hypothetical protein|nr:MAG: hypothetical protein DIU61_01185 [Bacteroidota bacterium]